MLVAALVVSVPLAWATDRFADVSPASVHHNDINTIAGAGITVGCNPPTNNLYCPADAVRRDQMASFLTRGLGRIAVSRTVLVSSVLRTTTNIYTDVAEVTINVGGSGLGTPQYVKVDASLNIYGTGECRCVVNFILQDVSTGQQSVGGRWHTPVLNSDETYEAVGVFDATPGPHTYRLRMSYLSFTTGVDPQSLAVGNAYIVATTYPFLSGSSQVSAAAAPAGR